MSSMPATRATAAQPSGGTPASAKQPLRPGAWSESALRVLRERYLAREGKSVLETPEEMCWRVAACLARGEAKYGKTPEQVEAIAQQFYDLMVDSIFLPNSPTLMNAGKDNGLQYSACYVLPVGDSMEEIFESVKNAAIIHKSGGGTGFAFSRLRPKDALVRSTGGKASGPVSFLRVFNGATEAVKQGGTRRGANMGILRVDHPDVLEFIESKLDGGIINFNISVAITDRFMEALRADGEYDLVEPHTGAVTGRLRARKVFDRIVQAAWQTGDPGLFFVDRCNAGRANPTPTLDKVEATNPCIAGDTLVATDRGLVRMAELVTAFAQGGIAVQVDPRLMPSRFLVFEATHNVPVTSYDRGCLPISQAFCSGERDTVRVRTKSGLELVCTPDHRVMTTRGWARAGELRVGTDQLFIQSGPGSFGSDPKLPFEVSNEIRGRNGRVYRHALPTVWSRELGVILGCVVGDGWLRSGDKNCRIGLTFGAGDRPLLEELQGTLDKWYGHPVRAVRRANGVYHLSYHGKFFVEFFEQLGVRPVQAAAKVVPETLFGAPREAVIGFLQGLFTADGTVRDNPQSSSAWIALTSKSRELLRGVQLLLNQLGIKSQIMERSRPAREGVFPYRTRGGATRSYTSDGVLFELGIFGESRDLFRREIGFRNAKQKRLESVRYRRFYRQKVTDIVVAVEPNGVQKVYDLTEPQSHTMIANGIVAHQCGEQPLYPNEACFAPETRITTDRGLETAADLYARQQRGETVLVAANLNGQGRHIVFRPAVVVKVGVKPTVRVTLSNGQQIRVTPDHRVLTQDGWKEAGTLCREDRVCIQTGMAGPLAITSTDGDLQRMLGWFTGDGWFTDVVGLTFGPEDELAFQRLVPIWRQFTGSAARVQTQQATMVRCVGTERTEAIAAFKAYGFASARGPKKRAPKFVFTAPKEEQICYLQGLFGADGSKTHRKPQVTLSSASLELLRDVQLLLLNLGMRSNIKYYPHRPTGRAWGQLKVNGESYHRFLDLIGFPLTPQKQERCDQFRWQRTKQDRLAVGVASVVAADEVEVYDVSEPVTHSLIAEGMIVHNCNLGSLNLAKFVKLGETVEGIDWAGMERAIRLSVRFLDDVIEVNPYPLPEINEAVKKNRRIGLGVMGWADLLCCLGIPYDSEAALELGDRVMGFIQEKGHDESRRLAEERGPFPTWPQSIYRDKGMLRNSTVTTIAPTGTISIIADCSSGVEPLFAVAFEHRVGERRLSFVNKHFEATAKARDFCSEALMQKVTERGTLHGLAEVPEDVRRVFVTAHEVAPEWHVRHQAVYQRHTDNGVSKCVTGDTLIFSDQGILRIQDLYRGESPDAFSPIHLKVADWAGPVEADLFYFGGKQAIVGLDTDLGFSLRATPNHCVRVMANGEIVWRRVDEIQVGDFLVVPYGLNFYGHLHDFKAIYGAYYRPAERTNANRLQWPSKITTDLARLLGYLIADGGFSDNQVIFTQKDDGVTDDYRRIMQQRFGVEPRVGLDSRREDLKQVVVNSRDLIGFFSDYLGTGERADTKHTPRCILASGPEVMKEYVRGLTLDGYVSERGRLIVLGTVSRRLAEEVQAILLNLGIVARLETKGIYYEYRHEENRKDACYEVVVLSRFRRAFLERIGFAEERKNVLAREQLTRRRHPDTHYVVPGVRPLAVSLARAKMAEASSEKLRGYLHSFITAEAEVTEETIRWLLDITRELRETSEWITLASLVSRKVMYTPVTRLWSDKEEVFDLQIPSTHSFITNGLISHNTINLRNSATPEDVRQAYLLAYETGCIGITVFRDGCKGTQVLHVGTGAKEKGKEREREAQAAPPAPVQPRPRVVQGVTYRTETPLGTAYITVNHNGQGEPLEVFANVGKVGSETAAVSEAIGRLISLCLRLASPVAAKERVRQIVEQLGGIGGSRHLGFGKERIRSLPDAIAKVLAEHVGMIEAEEQTEAQLTLPERTGPPIKVGDPCPECGEATLAYEEGCLKCYGCGFAEC